ncbi:P-loop containing nucleoside triphosphate hydrolase protein [Syncephalastrum racemosum]|uniref:RNA helicase n=1 Tax=Syncephalastrum racemosum TaxID=13706 RepID=A0A1X2HTU2_SYNRA|nr:P-loop containing nucleoside triphosphate hydrolase protein [Syncephalastrum racemosum]
MGRKSKKTVAGSARGFATASTPVKQPSLYHDYDHATENEQGTSPSKTSPRRRDRRGPKPDTPPLEQPEPEPEKAPRLARRFNPLNEYKAKTAFKSFQHVDHVEIGERVRPFALSSQLEDSLVQVLKKREEGDISKTVKSLTRRQSHPLDKDRAISTLDVHYRTLAMIGFQREDIERAFKCTIATSMDDLLDWLCLYVPYDRIPVGFFDKYYSEEVMSISAQLASDELPNVSSTTVCNTHDQAIGQQKPKVEEQDDLTIIPKKEESFQNDDKDYKARILQAAMEYDDNEEPDINEQYAELKVEVSQIESLLPTGRKEKKNRKKHAELSPEEIEEKKKVVEKLRKRMRDMEGNWEFDKYKAEDYYIEKQRISKERREEALIEESTRKSLHAPDPVAGDAGANTGGDDHGDDGFGFGFGDEDEDSGLFGNMMNEEVPESPIMPASTPAATWTHVDLSAPKSWKGRAPCDLLREHCKKHTFYSRQAYASKELGTRTWRATVKLIPEDTLQEHVLVEIPSDYVTANAKDAENLAATAALFHLDPESSVYRILPPAFKDIWLEWDSEKKRQEELPKTEEEERRMSLFLSLLEESYNSRKNNKRLPSRRDEEETETEDDMQATSDNVRAADISRSKLRRSEEIFRDAQQEFRSRVQNDGYKKMHNQRKQLPMAAYREQVLDLVREHQITIISGETGCGKSTQVPQFLAEELLLHAKDRGSVICTQPRRISAMSIAQRVSAEMNDPPKSIGSRRALVGYQIRLESKVSEENVLKFCTTGILLRRLETDPHLEGVTHIIVDEVHERTIESDFLLIVLRKLCQDRPDLRVILMSATLKAEQFSCYFGGCPVISVPGRTFPVQVQYLEDAIEATGFVLEEDSPYALRHLRVRRDQGSADISGKGGTSRKVRLEWFEEESDEESYKPRDFGSKLRTVDTIAKEMDEEDNVEDDQGPKYSRQTIRMLRRMDENKINYDLLFALLEYICSNADTSKVPEKGAILVFLPGMPEIRKLYDLLSSHPELGDSSKYLLIALHSTLSSEHQERAFEVPPDGIRKIVLSTNIAETGVTIKDVTVVVDTGMAKVVSYDEKRRVTQLQQTYISKANAHQRRGRAGRVQEGVCFHLFTQKRYQHMPNHELPEILRLPLEELCLRIKICELGSIREVLASALDPPLSKQVDNAIMTLEEVQALSSDGTESLTALGAHLANLPVDVHIGKMMMFGAIFRCLDPILTIAASLSYKSPFVRPFGKEKEADAARAGFRYADSDFLTIYNAYLQWRQYLITVKQSTSWRRKIRAFCSKHYLSNENLEMIEDMKRQFLGLLMSIGFVKADASEVLDRYELKRDTKFCQIPAAYNIYAQSVPVVNAALAAGLYPKIAEKQPGFEGDFMNKDLKLYIHPSSSLAKRELLLPTDFLIYNTVVMSYDKVSMWEVGAVDIVAIMLLAADMQIKHTQRRVKVDGWLTFECFARTAVLIKFLRIELNRWLTAKMDQPDLDLTEYSGDMMNVIVRVLEGKAQPSESK